MTVTDTTALAVWPHKGKAMNREPTDWEIVGMALVIAPVLYILLWLAMAIF